MRKIAHAATLLTAICSAACQGQTGETAGHGDSVAAAGPGQADDIQGDAAPVADARQGPSFNCAKASSAVEKAICGNPELARLDRRIAERFAALLKAMDQPGRAALRKDQQWFQGARDEGFGDAPLSDEETGQLKRTLAYRASFLARIDPTPSATPPPGLTGIWANEAGEIAFGADGSFNGNVAEPARGRWVCDAAGRVTEGKKGTFISVPEQPGWSIEVVRFRNFVELTEHASDGLAASSPYCGLNGTFAGSYFRVTKSVTE